jgi:hypothetical protein
LIRETQASRSQLLDLLSLAADGVVAINGSQLALGEDSTQHYTSDDQGSVSGKEVRWRFYDGSWIPGANLAYHRIILPATRNGIAESHNGAGASTYACLEDPVQLSRPLAVMTPLLLIAVASVSVT